MNFSEQFGPYKSISTKKNIVEDVIDFRFLRDNSTKIYVQSFFESEDMVNIFTDYIYNALYFYICRINMEINNFNNINGTNINPLHGLECIYLIFKGGNLMNMIHKTQLGNYKSVINNEVFARSDIDLSFYINVYNIQRYNEIYYFAINLLIAGLENITSMFDDYFFPRGNDNNYTIDSPNINTISRYPNNFKEGDDVLLGHHLTLQKYLRDLKCSFETINESIIIKHYDYIITNFNIDIVSSNVDLLAVFDEIEYVGLFVCIINFFINKNKNIYTNLSGLSVMINMCTSIYNHLLNTVKSVIGVKFDLIKKSEMYGSLKKEQFIINLSKSLQHLIETVKNKNIYSNTFLYDRIVKKINTITIPSFLFVPSSDKSMIPSKPVIFPNIIIDKKKKSLCILPRANPINFVNIAEFNFPQKHHYITYNNMICEYKNNSKIITDFDLLRSKLNIICEDINLFNNKNNNVKNEIDVPSEFIDISIAKYLDNTRILFTQELGGNWFMRPNVLNLGKGRTNVYTYTYENIANDIIYVLLSKNPLKPWLDLKYTKRINRFSFFYVLACYEHEKNKKINSNLNINFIEKHDNSFYNFKSLDKLIKLCEYVIEHINNCDSLETSEFLDPNKNNLIRGKIIMERTIDNFISIYFIKFECDKCGKRECKHKISYLKYVKSTYYDYVIKYKTLPDFLFSTINTSIYTIQNFIISWYIIYDFEKHKKKQILDIIDDSFIIIDKTCTDNVDNVIKYATSKIKDLLVLLKQNLILFSEIYIMKFSNDDKYYSKEVTNKNLLINALDFQSQIIRKNETQKPSNYDQKYIKYKNKYTNLKKIIKNAIV